MSRLGEFSWSNGTVVFWKARGLTIPTFQNSSRERKDFNRWLHTCRENYIHFYYCLYLAPQDFSPSCLLGTHGGFFFACKLGCICFSSSKTSSQSRYQNTTTTLTQRCFCVNLFSSRHKPYEKNNLTNKQLRANHVQIIQRLR